MVSGNTPLTPLISPKLVTGLDNYIYMHSNYKYVTSYSYEQELTLAMRVHIAILVEYRQYWL